MQAEVNLNIFKRVLKLQKQKNINRNTNIDFIIQNEYFILKPWKFFIFLDTIP